MYTTADCADGVAGFRAGRSKAAVVKRGEIIDYFNFAGLNFIYLANAKGVFK